jgi:hypothetical protein
MKLSAGFDGGRQNIPRGSVIPDSVSAFHMIGALSDAVEFQGCAPGLPDTGLNDVGDMSQVEVGRAHFHVGIGNADNWALKIFIG